jgi:hypothetical protein
MSAGADELRQELRDLFERRARGDVRDKDFRRLLAEKSVNLSRVVASARLAPGEAILAEHHLEHSHFKLNQSLLDEPEQAVASFFASARRLIRVRSTMLPDRPVSCDEADRTSVDEVAYENMQQAVVRKEIRWGEAAVGCMIVRSWPCSWGARWRLRGRCSLLGVAGMLHGLLPADALDRDRPASCRAGSAFPDPRRAPKRRPANPGHRSHRAIASHTDRRRRSSDPGSAPPIPSGLCVLRVLCVEAWSLLLFLEVIGLRAPRAKTTRDQQMARFRRHYAAFRRLLTANDSFLRGVADLDQKLVGQEPCGPAQVREASLRMLADVRRMIESLNEIADDQHAALWPPFERVKTALTAIVDPQRKELGLELVLDIGTLAYQDVDRVGAKMANLGEIRNHVGLPTPDGFALTVQAYQRFLETSGVVHRVDLENTKLAAQADEERASALLVDGVRKAEVPSEIEEAILAAYDRSGRQGRHALSGGGAIERAWRGRTAVLRRPIRNRAERGTCGPGRGVARSGRQPLLARRDPLPASAGIANLAGGHARGVRDHGSRHRRGHRLFSRSSARRSGPGHRAGRARAGRGGGRWFDHSADHRSHPGRYRVHDSPSGHGFDGVGGSRLPG